jgi:CRISPR/Cas system-associated protein endoribonuclease Cas2
VDGNPEILIQAKSKDTTNYASIYAFEFNNNKANKLDFPRLNNSQRKGYRGNDNFYIRDGKFMREFPIYSGSGKDAKPTGAKRQLEYSLRSNEFTVKQLSKDSTDVADNTQAKQNQDNKTTVQKSEKKSSSSKSSKKKRRRNRD